MALTKAQLNEFRKDIQEQLQIVELKHGCKIKMGNISYGDFNFTSKIEVEVPNGDGVIDTKEARDYKTHCLLFGLDPKWLNQNFTHQGEEWKVMGLNTRARKQPVIVKKRGSTGNLYKFPADAVARSFNMAHLPKETVSA